MVGNYMKSGPAATVTKLTQCTVAASGNSSGHPNIYGLASRYYVSGNLIDGVEAGWNKFTYDGGTVTQNGKHYAQDPNHMHGSDAEYITVSGTDYVCMVLDKAAPTGEVTTHTANKAFEKVLGFAGASLYRDEVDERYMNEAKNGTATYTGSVTKKKGLIDIVADCNGYTEENFPTGQREAGFDTDKDGIPDDWEVANGLNPNDKNDGNKYTIDTKGWYTNLEVYANSLVEDIMKAGNADGESNFAEYYPTWKSPTAINEIINTRHPTPNTQLYNLNGQKVDASYKGIVIVYGHKVVMK